MEIPTAGSVRAKLGPPCEPGFDERLEALNPLEVFVYYHEELGMGDEETFHLQLREMLKYVVKEYQNHIGFIPVAGHRFID